MLEMSMVPPNLLGHAWKKSEHLIGKLKRVSHGRFEGHDILHEMYSGKQQMWCIWEGEGRLSYYRGGHYRGIAISAEEVVMYTILYRRTFKRVEVRHIRFVG